MWRKKIKQEKKENSIFRKRRQRLKIADETLTFFFFSIPSKYRNDRKGIIYVTKGINPHKESR